MIENNQTEIGMGTQVMNTEIKHENPMYAESIFKIGNFDITNSLINSWGVVLLITLLAVLVGKSIKSIPGKVQGFFEFIIEFVLDFMDPITGSRQKTVKVLPLVLGIFFFVLLNNWIGMLPGVGSIGYVVEHADERIFVPYFRSGTADLKTTSALAIFAILVTHVWGVIAIGPWNHLNKFVNFKILMEIPKRVLKEPMVLIVNPIKFVVGLLEIVSELAKIASLSFRLFGNIFAGEVLLFSMASILAFVLPVPFLFMEIFVGLIQASIFAMLTLVFLTMSTAPEEH